MAKIRVLAGVVLCAAMAAGTALVLAAAPEPGKPFAVESAKSPTEAVAVLPEDYQPHGSYRLLVFFPGRQGEGFEDLQPMLAEADKLGATASELGAVLLFLRPTRPAGHAQSTAFAVIRQFLDDYSIDSDHVTAVGHAGGAAGALELAVRGRDLVGSVVLVAPVIKADDAPNRNSAIRPGVPVLILAGADALSAVRPAVLRALKAPKIVEAPLESADKIPADRIATFLNWADLDVTLDRRSVPLSARSVPGSGSSRQTALRALLAVRGAIDANLVSTSAADSAGADADATFLAAVAERFASVPKVLAEAELRRNTADLLASAKDDAEKQLAALKKSLASTPESKAERQWSVFRRDNFPWPDLVAQAVGGEEPTVAPTITEAQFVGAVQQRCASCHRRACASIDSLKSTGWVKPGDPSGSRLLTKRHRNPRNDRFTPDERQTLDDFIKQMK